MSTILMREEFGAYAKFKHEPSTQEAAEVSIAILNQIACDIRAAKGVLISVDQYYVIYRTPADDEKFKSLLKAQELLPNNLSSEVKWTFGIKTDIAFLVQEEDQHIAFERCQTRLAEGISPDPFLTID